MCAEGATLSQRITLYDLRQRLGQSAIGVHDMSKEQASAAIKTALEEVRRKRDGEVEQIDE